MKMITIDEAKNEMKINIADGLETHRPEEMKWPAIAVGVMNRRRKAARFHAAAKYKFW